MNSLAKTYNTQNFTVLSISFEKANAEIERLEKLNAQVITLEDDEYPDLLREIHDPPIALYVRGNLPKALERPALAVVGSRRCSTYGVNVAESLSRDLASHGLTIVSGLARGIDAGRSGRRAGGGSGAGNRFAGAAAGGERGDARDLGRIGRWAVRESDFQ